MVEPRRDGTKKILRVERTLVAETWSCTQAEREHRGDGSA